MAANGIHISLAAEPLFEIGGFVITNSMFTSLIVSGLLIGFALIVNKQLKQTDKPSGLQNVTEWIIESLFNLVYSVTGDLKKARQFFPIVATLFLFILLNNWIGLLPGVGTIVATSAEAVEHVEEADDPASEAHETLEVEPEDATFGTIEETDHTEDPLAPEAPEETAPEAPTAPEADSSEVVLTEAGTHEEDGEHAEKLPTPFLRPGTADLNTTLALGLVTMIAVQVFGVQSLSLGYFKKFFNFSSPIMFYVGVLELISEVAKVVSFAFRLFGNIFAGEVLLVVITELTKVGAPIPFYGLEVFVGFIQAFVFAMLSLVLYNMATISHEGDEH